ncbi:hypothetical protein [Alterinioella nitratireducens]|uniref:hypothetical protein n=1 Tax=Alterinioella nitratireducens TaxID=2735915 RepID=UPI001556A15B|nr:hypothetical protein [Alterinioella nitratireducens]NPD18846.1 hypothetical protein [Alterinioella nitratireducens]
MTALSALLRKTPGEALREYFDRPEIGLPTDFDWTVPEEHLPGPLKGAIEDMSRRQRDRILNDAERVTGLADEPGQAALYSVAEDPAYLDGLANPHARALWMFINAQDHFRHAEEVRFTEDQRRGRMWAGYMTEPGHDVQRDGAARHAFVSAIKEFSGAAHAHVDIFDRVRTTHEGDECDLVQVTIYREGRPDDLLRFDENGALVRQAYRPVFEAAVTYEPANGGIEVIANDKLTRIEMVKAAVTHLLGIEFKENRLPLRCYDLSVLLTPYDFPVDPEDGIEGVEVRELRLMPIDDSSRRVTLENMARADGTIWSMAEELFEDRTPLRDGFVITRAKLAVKLAKRPGGDRRRTLTLAITWPHGCNLKDRTATEQMIGEKYLRRWGILVDDLQLFED